MSEATKTHNKPLPPDDLIRDRSSDFLANMEIPDKLNYRNLIRKLENKAKHLEIQIEQNRKRGAMICQECFNAMRSTEVLAFDFLFAEFLLGNIPISYIYSFVDSCIKPNFNIVSGDPREIDAAADHVRTVQNHIQSSISSIIKSDPKKVEMAKRANDLVQFLNEKKQNLENEIKRSEDDTKNQRSNQTQQTVITINFDDENMAKDIGNIDPDFENWLLNNLKPGAVSIDEKTSENRTLFGTCVHRIQAINELKEQIAKLKSSTLSVKNLQYIDCDPSTIYSSPFFRAVQENCKFLGTALKAIHEHQQIIPGCISALDNCEFSLKDLEKRCQNTVNQMRQNVKDSESMIEQEKAQIAALSEKLKPYAEALKFDPSSFDSLLKETEETDQNIEKTLKNMFDNSPDESVKEKLDAQINLLHELRETRQNVFKLCQTSFTSISNNIKIQNDLFKTIFSYSKAFEYVQLCEKEVQQLREYEKALKDVIDVMKFDEIKEWCNQLNDVTDSIIKAVKTQEEIYESFEPLIQLGQEDANKEQNDISTSDELAEKEHEVENLMNENSKLVEEETKLLSETADAEEELFKLLQEMQALAGWSNPELEAQLSDLVICPFCKERKRSQILTSCGHPLCSDCISMAKEKHKCPICHELFNDENIAPFIL